MSTPTTEQLQADLAARDALIGELRTTGNAIIEEYYDARSQRKRGCICQWETLLARTPADAGAELRKYREDIQAAAGELMLPIPQPGTDMARMMIANRLMHGERDALRAQLAEKEDALRKADGVRSLYEDAVARAEAAEARVRELESERENWRVSSVCRAAVARAEQAEVRLRAVIEAGELSMAMAYAQGYSRGHDDTVEACYVDVVAEDHETYFAEDIAEEIRLGAFPQWVAARSGDLPSHPDAVPILGVVNPLSGRERCGSCGEYGHSFSNCPDAARKAGSS